MHTLTYVLACARTGGRTCIRVGGVSRTNSATNGKLENEGVSRQMPHKRSKNGHESLLLLCASLGRGFSSAALPPGREDQPENASTSFHGRNRPVQGRWQFQKA